VGEFIKLKDTVPQYQMERQSSSEDMSAPLPAAQVDPNLMDAQLNMISHADL